LNKRLTSDKIKELAKQAGFNFCGIAKAQRLDDDAARLESWLNKGMHGTMKYMENYFDLRTDPTKLVPGARSVITLMYNYYSSEKQNEDAPRISKYAYGEDYHEVIREKLNQFLFMLRETFGEVQGRGFVDSAPVLERSWAQRSGLGWIGKNGNLIVKGSGSFFFLATLITDLDAEPDDMITQDFCGSCNRCIEACPTEAILPNKEINGSKCISYFTIELKDELIPAEMKEKFQNWMFGCDVCQDVCPWNRFSQPNTDERFRPIREILNLSTEEWEEMSEEAFKKIFRNSPLKRSKFKGIKRNLAFLRSNDQ
jgi:epoxyqueuosine reductase